MTFSLTSNFRFSSVLLRNSRVLVGLIFPSRFLHPSRRKREICARISVQSFQYESRQSMHDIYVCRTSTFYWFNMSLKQYAIDLSTKSALTCDLMYRSVLRLAENVSRAVAPVSSADWGYNRNHIGLIMPAIVFLLNKYLSC